MNHFTIPEPLAVLEAKMPHGAVIRVRQHGNISGRRVLVSHGNGLASNGYYPFWRLLEADFEVLVYDQRNHGENPFFGSFGNHVDGFASDLACVLEQITARFGPKPNFGAYHSVSAVAALAHAVTHSWPWEKLVLFDPPVVPTPSDPLHEEAFRSERFLATWALSRDHEFDHPDVLTRHLSSVRGMQRWAPGAHELMARSVLRQHADQWRLSCPRELEASVYLSNGLAPIWQHLDLLTDRRERLLILTADPESEDARYPPRSAQRMHARFGFEVHAVPETNHMLQLEQPERCAALVEAFFNQ